MIIEREITVHELLDLIAGGKRHFKNVEVLETIDKITAGFDNIIFEECILALDFTGSSFRNTKFINSNIKTSIFKEADLSYSEFIDNMVCSCDFTMQRSME